MGGEVGWGESRRCCFAESMYFVVVGRIPLPGEFRFDVVGFCFQLCLLSIYVHFTWIRSWKRCLGILFRDDPAGGGLIIANAYAIESYGVVWDG